MLSAQTALDVAVHNAPKTSGIYAIKNKCSGKCYVGQAANLQSRLATHLRQLRGGKHHSPILTAAFAKYEESDWLFEIVELCEREVLTARETYWASAMGALADGYNSAPIQSGVNVTDDFREVARNAALKYHARVTNEDRRQAALKAAATRRKRKEAAETSSRS
jgi:group I intron endonuclease